MSQNPVPTLQYVSTERRADRSLGEFLRSSSMLVLLGLTCLTCLTCGPIGPISGGHLGGEERGSLSDWGRVAAIENAQLETNLEAPHSINIWFVVVDGNPFVATSLLRGPAEPEQREWVKNVEADPRVRIRIEGVVYPARLEVVRESALRARLFDAYLEKYPNLDPTREQAARFYRVAPRGPAS